MRLSGNISQSNEENISVIFTWSIQSVACERSLLQAGGTVQLIILSSLYVPAVYLAIYVRHGLEMAGSFVTIECANGLQDCLLW